MKLKAGNFYLLQDISPEKPAATSLYGTGLFKPFEEAAIKNGFNAVAVRQVPGANPTRLPMVEFVVAADTASKKVTKALQSAGKKLKRTLAIRTAM